MQIFNSIKYRGSEKGGRVPRRRRLGLQAETLIINLLEPNLLNLNIAKIMKQCKNRKGEK